MNQAVNFFWTILCFIPVIAVWAVHYSVLWICVFLVISTVTQLFPSGRMQLSNNPEFYQRLGVKFIRKFVQNGDWVNKLIRKSQPHHKLIKAKGSAAGYMGTLIMYERFHLLCFFFFMLTAVYAIAVHLYMWSVLTLLSNIIYNFYPIILQQYNRTRIARISK
ncbi:hypothetical protein FFF34_010650 [Inquilinus sp. KBS0705]|nr:hypothetical protein FFF34_010650 [Inquilinus sp. KBS0705]